MNKDLFLLYYSVDDFQLPSSKSVALLHKTRKLSHLWVGLEIGLTPEAVTLHWPVLPGFWRSVALTEIPIGTCTVGTLTASTG